MRIDTFTVFPALMETFYEVGLIGKARRSGVLDLRAHDLRMLSTDPHRAVDDAPFGGGAGMVLSPEPVFKVVEEVAPPRPVFVLSAAGRKFDQAWARQLAEGPGLSLICGRYEGVDQRVADHLADGEMCVTDAVLSGGEVAAMVVIEAVSRLVPGVMGNSSSAGEESFEGSLLEHPQWTRPAEFRGHSVPPVLLSGDHGRVARWRRAQALARTLANRPDLIDARGGLTDEERQLLDDLDRGRLS